MRCAQLASLKFEEQNAVALNVEVEYHGLVVDGGQHGPPVVRLRDGRRVADAAVYDNVFRERSIIIKAPPFFMPMHSRMPVSMIFMSLASSGMLSPSEPEC